MTLSCNRPACWSSASPRIKCWTGRDAARAVTFSMVREPAPLSKVIAPRIDAEVSSGKYSTPLAIGQVRMLSSWSVSQQAVTGLFLPVSTESSVLPLVPPRPGIPTFLHVVYCQLARHKCARVENEKGSGQYIRVSLTGTSFLTRSKRSSSARVSPHSALRRRQRPRGSPRRRAILFLHPRQAAPRRSKRWMTASNARRDPQRRR